MECVSCKEVMRPDDPECPRCKTDNEYWQRLQEAPPLEQLWEFLRRTVGAFVAWLVATLGALIMVGAALWKAVTDNLSGDWYLWLAGAIIGFLLSGTAIWIAYGYRWTIREYELLREVKKQWRPSFLTIATFFVLLGIGFALLAVLLPLLPQAQELPPDEPFPIPPTAIPSPSLTQLPTLEPSPTPPNGRGAVPLLLVQGKEPLQGLPGSFSIIRSVDPVQGPEPPEEQERMLATMAAPLLLGLAVGLFSLGIALLAALLFVQALNRSLPSPIFNDRTRMARVLRREAELILESGRKSRNWATEYRWRRYDHDQEEFYTAQRDKRDYDRSTPPERIAVGIWETLDGRETLVGEHIEHTPRYSQREWEVYENRPTTEVRTQRMWRTDEGNFGVRLEVLDGDSERIMRQGDEFVRLRLRELRHYEMIADEWGRPLELRDADDHRLVQLVRRDVSIIEPPEPLSLPQI
jgi:hypothetical protein